jgi:chemotaxis protein MotB
MTEAERKSAITGLRHDRSGVRIMLPAANLFPSGSSKLRLPALQSLDRIAEILKLSNREIVIEGHTDNQALVSGTMESNWELGSLRATSIVRYLMKYHKIPGDQLSAASYADQRPLAPNDTESNRAKNRRIEIFILNRTAEN